MSDILQITGSGDAPGVPRVYCDCDVCTSARLDGTNRRTRSSALLRTEAGDAWLDCGPDWRAPMEAAGLRFVETVLLTHAHHDYIGGLPKLYDACRRVGREYGLPSHVTLTQDGLKTRLE